MDTLSGRTAPQHFAVPALVWLRRHKLVYDAREQRIAGYRCACGFIHAAGLDPEDLARMGWMEGYRRQYREMRV